MPADAGPRPAANAIAPVSAPAPKPAGAPVTTASTTPPPATTPTNDDAADAVAALVNDAPITEYDVRQRVLLFIATSGGLQATPDVIAKLRPQILAQLETEQLQIQEARRKNITVSPTDVDKSIDRIINDNHLTKEQLADLLKKGGVDMSTLRGQIAVQIAWQKAVQDEFSDRINIKPEDIDDELARQMEGADKPHFLVSSIFFAVDNPDMDAKVLKDAQDVLAQLKSGAQFSSVARQFSQSPTAASGGDLGWVHQGQLPSELDTALQRLQPGMVSDPIRSTGGYYILGLRDRQEGVNAKIPDPATQRPTGPLTVERLLLPIGPTPKKELLDNVMKIAAQIHEHVNGCDMLPKVQEQVHGLVVQDIQKMGLKITDLAPEIQDAINKAGPGESTPPFKTPAGVEMMQRCDKRAPVLTKWTTPTRQQVEENLFDAQITMLSRRYLRDLRRSAHVEIK
ncbi:MAG: peptidylprolyl isomerase [Alphaproteobacteria bacterium]|nr:peptidylprolyl isomerase [Alphaproteobacteria bacterium]MBL6939949.1 peptidylprolyl isomerase [Alphaproteobacteria bacterium]MBL7099867.1 peptidylprolyl isomerase [Alphaproteobacteria bacterium]